MDGSRRISCTHHAEPAGSYRWPGIETRSAMNKAKLLGTIDAMPDAMTLYVAIPFPTQLAAEAWLVWCRKAGFYGRVLPNGHSCIVLITFGRPSESA